MKSLIQGARFIGKYGESGDILDADFLHFFGLDLNVMIENDFARACGLAGNLPKEARVFEAELGGPILSLSDSLLLMIEYWQHQWVYAHTDDSKNKVNKPEIMLPDYLREVQLTLDEREKMAVTPESIRDWVYGAEFR